MVFVGITFYFINLKGLDFLYFFVPKNVPTFILPFLIVIEIISYISRLFSLAIRLFANMVAGHSLLNILSNAVLLITKQIVVFEFIVIILSGIPLAIVFIIYLLEIIIAFLQSYVFTTLSCIYINDIYSKH